MTTTATFCGAPILDVLGYGVDPDFGPFAVVDLGTGKSLHLPLDMLTLPGAGLAVTA